ncbi:MAG TPA: Uma2 family endonuclease [Ginsengibacter sp.]
MEVNEAAPKYYPKMSPSEFLEWERKQEYRHEYAGGEIFAMAGASMNHNRISSNIIGRTWNHLQGKDCNIYPGDLRISVKSRSSFFYPDATIICGEPEFDDNNLKDTVKNPAVIFEILSPSTEDYDIGKKLFFYMQIESLQQYIIIDSRNMHIRITTKMENGTWKFLELTDKDETLFINSVKLEVRLADVYEGLKF